MMIRLCIFDMGGVLVRNHNVAPQLLPFIGSDKKTFSQISERISDSLALHSRGVFTENEFWHIYHNVTGIILPEDSSLLGKFFRPYIDQDTYNVIVEIKKRGVRVVCGTNVIDSHYAYHVEMGQYDIFDKVYPSHLIHLTKPDHLFYRYILEKEAVLPEEAFFTDDLEVNVKSANSLGINGFVYRNAEELQDNLKFLGVL